MIKNKKTLMLIFKDLNLAVDWILKEITIQENSKVIN